MNQNLLNNKIIINNPMNVPNMQMNIQNINVNPNQFNPMNMVFLNQIQMNQNVVKNNNINNIINNNKNNSKYILAFGDEMLGKSIQFLQLDKLKGYEADYFPIKGLNNVGLTCYMNSTLQCLIHILDLTYYFCNCYNEFKSAHLNMMLKTETEGKISAEYRKVLDGVYTDKKHANFFGIHTVDAFSPKDFNNLISKLNPQFAKYESNDAKDLLTYLLQEMHEELNYYGSKKLDKIPKCNQLDEESSFQFFYLVNSTMNFSIISYLFWGVVKQTTTCMICKNRLYNFQYFQYLSFPLYKYTNKRFNFYSGLKDYIKPEILQGDNQFYCQICRMLRNATVESKICYPSPYLIINLDYGKNKIYNPDSIDFGTSIYITQEFLKENIPEVRYDLVAVSSHIGSSGNAGHYIAFCRDAKNTNLWHKFNDSTHTECQFDETKKYSPYLLIFKKN